MQEEKLSEKYDRQIRLWGVHGQRRLGKASICLLGCGGAGTEALKNLVLPGCGCIVICDDRTVKLEHLGNSFFLQRSSLGRSLADQTLQHLLEMNSDVKGTTVNKRPSDLINEAFLSQYSIYISNNLEEKDNIILSRMCQKLDKPVLFLNTYGFYAYIRNQKTCHEIHQVRENKKYDLRIREPFSELLEFCNQFDLEKLIADQTTKNVDQLTHIPYVVILIKAFQVSKNRTTNEVMKIISQWKSQVNHESAENFSEALKNAFRINLSKQSVLQEVEQVLGHSMCLEVNRNSNMFWKFVKTLQLYILEHSNYPQSHSLPDMHASTDYYISLKRVYKQEHNRTKVVFKSILDKQFPQASYDESELETFVENVMSLSIVELKPFYKEIKNPNFSFESDWYQVYIALRGADLFKKQQARVPTSDDYQLLREYIQCIINAYPSKDVMFPKQEVIREICRSQGAELISISSIAGSIAAQQVIKLVTNQFTPMKSGYFFDGTRSEGQMVDI